MPHLVEAKASPYSFVVIDSQVSDWQSLIADINPNTSILVLDSARDGLAQIAEAVAKENSIDALHIISHGTIGSLQLGASTINSNNLNTYHDQLTIISNALTDNSDILLYGCEVAQGEIGQGFIEQLASLTGSAIAASATLVGNTDLGGDWLLDACVGNVEAVSVLSPEKQAAYKGILGNSIAIFTAYNATNGNELWVTDGTAAGTTFLKYGYVYSGGISVNGKALFAGADTTHGAELWITDGTATGTTLVKDIYTGAGSSQPYRFTTLENGKVLFEAADTAYNYELWITDGTAAGTTLVKDICVGIDGSNPSDFTVLGDGRVLFSARGYSSSGSFYGDELWITDGTEAGTTLVKDIRVGYESSSPSCFTVLGNGKAVFTATDATNDTQLWITDGTEAGTTLLKDIYSCGGVPCPPPQYLTALGNGKVLFQAKNIFNGTELWITDGTEAGTTLLKDIRVGYESSNPYGFTTVGNGKVLFRADDGINGAELWITDGTEAGTMLVKDIYAGTGSSYPLGISPPLGAAVLGNGKALFAAGDGINGCELWITDGTTAGTMLFKDIYAGTSSSYPDQITALGNGKVLFRADDGINGFELWVTDGTAAGTMLLEDIYAGANSSGPRNFIVLGDVNTRPTLSAASATAILTEAGGIANSTTGTAASSITLTKSDVDVGDSASYDTIYLTTNGWISSDSGLIYAKTGTYGTAILTLATDTISYTLNDNAPATQALTRDAPAEAVVLQGSDSFTVQIIDTHGATASTNVVFNINGSNDAPVIGGATAVIYINDNATVTPFSNLTITDPDTGAMAIVTITLDNASKGVFTTASLTASGFSTSNGGLTYAQAASTPDALQAAIRSLVYQPTPNHVAPNSTETTTFTVSVSDGLAAPVSASTTVISTSINNAPVIGITSVTTINDTATATPFSSLTITDPDISALETVTITLDNANKGVFTAASLTASGFGTNDGGLTYIHAADTPAALQAAIRSLVYKPTINHVLPNSTESTFLQLVSVMVLRQPLSMQIPKLSQLQ